MKRILTVSATVALILCMVLSLGIFVSAESTITESDWIQAPEKTLVKCAGGDCDHTECDYVYSFAVIGDTQCLVRIDATAFATALKSDPTLTYESYEKAHIKNLYNWILDNKDDKNIQYVLGLGDITEAFQSTSGYYAREWGLSKAAIELLNGKIGYSLVRGNHDVTTGFNSAFGKGTQYYSDLEALAKTTDAEGRPMAGFLNPDKIEDTYRKIVIGEHKYIIFTVDYYATEACVTWINEILEENSDYTAIITIHEMLNRDHSFSDAYETTTPAEGLEKENWQEALSSGGNVSPRALWENALSKHANVKLILCGHIDEDDIKTSQLMGENGNTVTLMLIDGQTIDKSIEPVGLVTMFYISADGKVMNVEHISTVRAIAEKNAYLKDVNQFEITIDYSDANGNGWTVTPYGNIPNEFYNSYPLHILVDDDGVEDNDTVYHGGFSDWSGVLDKIEALNQIGGIGSRTSRRIYVLMSKDYSFNGNTDFNLASIPSGVVLDLNGKTLTLEGDGAFLPYYNASSEHTASITLKNGSVSMKGDEFIALQTLEGGAGSSVRIYLEDLSVVWNGTSAPLVSTLDGYAGITANVNLTVKNCSFDTSKEEAQIEILDLDDTSDNNAVKLKLIGGEINGTTLSNTVIASLNKDNDSILFEKNSGGKYLAITLKESVEFGVDYITIAGWKLQFTAMTTTSPYRYEIEAVADHIEQTPYGKISLNVYPLDDYPLALFQNGEIVTAYATWSEFYSNIANVDTSEANNTVLYLRNNIDHASSVANADNKLRTIKHLTIDLNGKTLSASGAQVFSFVVLGNVDFTTNIFVKNGTVSANKANSPIVTFNSSISTSIKASYNITFTDVTLTKTNAGRLLADAFSSGTTGSTNTIVLNNCIIDATGETQLCKLEEANDQNKLDIAIVINGGKIIATKNLVFASFSAERESGKGSPDSLTFGKYNGAYTTYTNSSYAAPTTAFDTVNEGKAFFKATQTAGEYLLTLCTHSGGTATCAELAICELCGAKYGTYGACASFSFDSFSGRYLCVSCGARCEHTSFNDGKCKLCNYACVHDWTVDGVNATCSVCGETCESSQIPTLDATCSACKSNSAYANGVCTECGTECNHLFNAGGHCSLCGEFGNAITFADGKNGGANASSNNGNSLVVGDGVYTSADGSYKQLWDYRDTNGSLLGRNYVFSAKFTFDDWKYVSGNTAGTTRLLIWANGDVSASTTKFALYMFGNKGKLELSPDHDDASTRMTLELNKEYDIRVAIRSEESSDGIFAHTAEISVNGQLMWTRSFELTAENGMAIRLGDHTPRKTQVKYSVSDDFGIHCIDENISFIGVQEKDNANYNYDLAYDLRFIFGIDDIYLSDVGVKVEAEMTGSIIYDDVSGELICSSSRTVLNNVLAGGKVCTPGAYGAGYGGNYIALAITDIPLDPAATYTFTLTPYVTYHSGETVFSETSHKITVSFIDGKMNIGYEK